MQRGQTTWVLRQACPDAEFHCFDINLSRLVYRDPRATYVERDWETRPFEGVDGARSLGFFDDHQNQAKRVRQAHDRGFRHLLFDDTVPVHKIYADGEPPLPTVSMLLDPLAVVGETYEWVCHGTAHRYHYTEADTHGARALIRDLVAFPDTSHITRHGRSSFPTYVRLVD